METPQPNTNQPVDIIDEPDFLRQGYDKHIKNARIMLFIVAGLQLLPLVMLPKDIDPDSKMIIIAITIFVALVFAGLAFWTKKKPYHALLAALIFYVALVALNAFIDPKTLLQGLIMKIIVIVLLIMGFKNAKEAKEEAEAFGRQ